MCVLAVGTLPLVQILPSCFIYAPTNGPRLHAEAMGRAEAKDPRSGRRRNIDENLSLSRRQRRARDAVLARLVFRHVLLASPPG